MTYSHSPMPSLDSFLPRFRATRKIGIWFFVPFLVFLALFLFTGQLITHTLSNGSAFKDSSVHLVLAASIEDDLSWLSEHFPRWASTTYTIDDVNATLAGELDFKAQPSMAYLTYIIDNYANLPPYIFFLRGRRHQWNNEDPIYDNVPVLRNMRRAYVAKHGFATLRCTWAYGCPALLHPVADPSPDALDIENGGMSQLELRYADAFTELFAELPLPSVIGVHCGGQFVASRAQIRRRPRADYMWYRQWLMESALPPQMSGLILEYSWHIIMGQPAVLCPHAGTCFCEKFGLCKLDCTEDACTNRYWKPHGILPDRWPAQGPGTEGWPPLNWAD